MVHANARSREVVMLVDDPFDAFLKSWSAEIEKKAERHFEQSEILENLFGMDSGQIFK